MSIVYITNYMEQSSWEAINSQPVKKFPKFSGTHWFIIVFTEAHHLNPEPA